MFLLLALIVAYTTCQYAILAADDKLENVVLFGDTDKDPSACRNLNGYMVNTANFGTVVFNYREPFQSVGMHYNMGYYLVFHEAKDCVNTPLYDTSSCQINNMWEPLCNGAMTFVVNELQMTYTHGMLYNASSLQRF